MLGCKRFHALFHDTITAQMYEIVFSEAKKLRLGIGDWGAIQIFACPCALQ